MQFASPSCADFLRMLPKRELSWDLYGGYGLAERVAWTLQLDAALAASCRMGRSAEEALKEPGYRLDPMPSSTAGYDAWCAAYKAR